MQIVFNPESVEEIRQRYTLVELETFDVPGSDVPLTAFCVVPVEKLAFMDLDKLQEQKANHQVFLNALRNSQWDSIIAYYNIMRGSFGGELDSFYSEIVSRANLNLEDKHDV
jgi:hypothetical protein